MAQKSYKKKIHNKVTVYQTNKLPTGMKISRIMKIIEKKIPKHFLSEVDTLIIADLEKIGTSEGMVEGDTIFIDSQQYCEDLLIENFIILVGESLFSRYEGEINEDKVVDEFIKKRRDLYYDLVEYNNNIALSDFLVLEDNSMMPRYFRKLNFEDVILNVQKYFINYDSCLSLKNYFSHHFAAHINGEISKKEYKELSSKIVELGKMCKENTYYEEKN